MNCTHMHHLLQGMVALPETHGAIFTHRYEPAIGTLQGSPTSLVAMTTWSR